MATILPLQPADPAEIGGFSLLGRLREDERARVFLARESDGGQVEIAWMREEPAGFETAAAALTGVSAPSLARVLATGTLEDRPYLVSEHVAGAPLDEVVTRDGPWPGPALHRLGIALASALVGLHQRGVIHGDLHPGTVVVGADGITVTGYGMTGLTGLAAADAETRALGQLAYTTPERMAGQGPEAVGGGPAADVFAWAATVLFAATGTHVFQGTSTAGTVNRVLTHEPGLEPLEEHVRPIVEACLAKDPARRPEAGEVLLRLVGHSTQTIMGFQALAGRTPAGRADGAPVSRAGGLRAGRAADAPARRSADVRARGAADVRARRSPDVRARGAGGVPADEADGVPAGRADGVPAEGAAAEGASARRAATGTRPPASGRRRLTWPVLSALAAGGVAVAVASAVGGHLLADRVIVAPAAAPSISLPDLSATAPRPATLPSPSATVRATGIALTLHEHPTDPVRFVGYVNERGAWLRTAKDGGFAEAGTAARDVAASPDGAWLALLGEAEVTVLARATGRRFTVPVPKSAAFPAWDRSSARLLLTLTGPGADRPPTGFAVLDRATRQVREVDTGEQRHKGSGAFAWMPGGDQVAISYATGSGDGLRIRDLDGRQVRTMPWTGASVGRSLVSPSGRLLMTDCPSGGSQCAWDAVTGVRVATYVNTIDKAELWGWYDDDHLMVLDPTRTPHEFVALDFRGGTRRLLATIAAEDYTDDLRMTRAAR